MQVPMNMENCQEHTIKRVWQAGATDKVKMPRTDHVIKALYAGANDKVKNPITAHVTRALHAGANARLWLL